MVSIKVVRTGTSKKYTDQGLYLLKEAFSLIVQIIDESVMSVFQKYIFHLIRDQILICQLYFSVLLLKNQTRFISFFFYLCSTKM